MYTPVEQNEVVRCPKCSGSGKFYGRGTTINGVFHGYIGKCYTCRGSGVQTHSDFKRCETYWAKYARIN